MHPPDTPRLQFRSWTHEDEPLARRLWGDPRVTARIDARPRIPDEAIRERLLAEIALEREHGFQYWPIFEKNAAFIGACGLKPYEEPRVFEMGFHLVPEHWGKGYATEAAAAVITHAHIAFGAVAVVAGHHPDNAASKRTLEKLGFRFLERSLFPPTGLVHPFYRRDLVSS